MTDKDYKDIREMADQWAKEIYGDNYKERELDVPDFMYDRERRRRVAEESRRKSTVGRRIALAGETYVAKSPKLVNFVKEAMVSAIGVAFMVVVFTGYKHALIPGDYDQARLQAVRTIAAVDHLSDYDTDRLMGAVKDKIEDESIFEKINNAGAVLDQQKIEREALEENYEYYPGETLAERAVSTIFKPIIEPGDKANRAYDRAVRELAENEVDTYAEEIEMGRSK